MRQPIPAPGFQTITGTRAPPKKMGTHLWCQIRGNGLTSGWVDSVPWPVADTRWRWELDGSGNVIEHPGDVVAVKRIGRE